MSLYSSTFYTSDLESLFSDKRYIEFMLKAESALIEAQALQGLVPASAVHVIKAVCDRIENIDVEKIKKVSDSIIVYAPEVDDIYGGKPQSTHFDYDGLENQMEGKFRPGHFDGVGTVVKKLFEIVTPNYAYFGEKDFQQLQIVKKMVSKEKMPVTVIGCPIYREKNGLAMSSRNQRLTTDEREKASIIYKKLLLAKELFGTKSAKEVKKRIEQEFNKQNTFQLEYFEIADEATLLPVSEKEFDKKYRGFIAIFIENIRLIDNVSLN